MNSRKVYLFALPSSHAYLWEEPYSSTKKAYGLHPLKCEYRMNHFNETKDIRSQKKLYGRSSLENCIRNMVMYIEIKSYVIVTVK